MFFGDENRGKFLKNEGGDGRPENCENLAKNEANMEAKMAPKTRHFEIYFKNRPKKRRPNFGVQKKGPGRKFLGGLAECAGLQGGNIGGGRIKQKSKPGGVFKW